MGHFTIISLKYRRVPYHNIMYFTPCKKIDHRIWSFLPIGMLLYENRPPSEIPEDPKYFLVPFDAHIIFLDIDSSPKSLTHCDTISIIKKIKFIIPISFFFSKRALKLICVSLRLIRLCLSSCI